ncbi:MAG: sodium:proton antiporter [Sedimenticola sp.]|nr:sodium:proton antiporter [Sedimenticola sp.]
MAGYAWLLRLLLLLLAVGLGYAVLSLPDQAQGLQPDVLGKMDQSGVTHPVTAVLLNFRGYDTLLEMAVLLLALLGIWSLGGLPEARPESEPGPVLGTLTQVLVPVLIVVAGYLLWTGAHAPGGAFQAGAVLGAAGVLLQLTGWRLPRRAAGHPLRITLVAGVAVFLIVAALPLPGGRQLLEYDPNYAGVLILVVEAFATVSIGVTLAALFFGADPTDKAPK